ncbi:MAG: hypothetical protein ACOYJZ_05775 [Acutalibacter sp.]|jgi:hypothetical protein
MKKSGKKILTVVLCVLVVSGGLTACSPKEAGSQDNLFQFILQEGTLVPSRGEFLTPMEQVLEDNGWTEDQLEDMTQGEGKELTQTLEVAGLPQVTETLTFQENTVTQEPQGMVLMGVSYLVSAGEEDPQEVWQTLAQQAEAVLTEEGDIALLTPENGVAQGESTSWGDREGNQVNVTFSQLEETPTMALVELHSGEITAAVAQQRSLRGVE